MPQLIQSGSFKNLAENGNWIPIGETTWLNPEDKLTYVGSEVTPKGEIPTYKKAIGNPGLYWAIKADLEKQRRGAGAGTGKYNPDSIFKAFHKSTHSAVQVYFEDYEPRLRKGKTFSQIRNELKRRGQGAATLSGQTFATLRNQNTQFRIFKFIERTPHVLLNFVQRFAVPDLMEVYFGEFAGSDSISEDVGEFEAPQTGLGEYTEHHFGIKKYIGGFNIAPEFFNYDYGQYDIVGDHLRDQVGEIEEIRNKRVYELWTGPGVGTVPAAGLWNALDPATGWNVNNPLKDINPIKYAMETGGRGIPNFVVMNGNVLAAYETNTYLGPAQNPNDTRTAVLPTDIPTGNTAGGISLVGLRGYRVGLDSMFTNANGFLFGSDEATMFADGPSASRSYVEQQSEVLVRQNKWWFGAYLYDATLLKRITGVI